MNQPLTLNCDMGEGFGPWKMGNDEGIMPLIDAANIACGGHAGDPSTMRQCVALARKHDTEIGAHVSYPDKEGFGRRAMDICGQALVDLIHYQVGALDGIARAHGRRVTYIKPHGALYNDMMINGHLRSAVMASVADSACSSLMLQATAHQETHRQEADMFGIQLIFEVFADRAYQDCGALVPRNQPGAILDKEKMLAQVSQLSHQGSLTTISGNPLKLDADSLCVHGDNPQAVSEISQIRAMLKA